MSSKYPILDNKPIDQWKVTELKEELKRRRLLVKGLKDELIRRLDDALRTERVNEGKDVITGDDLVADQPEDEAQFVGDKPGDEAKSVNAQPEGQAQISEAPLVATEAAGNTDAEVECADDAKVQDNAFDSVRVSSKEFSEGVAEQAMGSSGLKDDLPDNYPTLFSENVAPKVTLGNKDAEVTEKLVLNGDSENQTLKPELDHLESQVENEGSNQKPQLEKEAMRSPSEHVMVDSSTPNNQVSEVSPTFGFQVKSDSISTDSMSINEKIEVKDNIISDNVNLELDNVKPEMVEPSTANHVPVVGESNTMDVEEQEEKVASVEVKDDINTSNADLSKKNDIIDLGYSEKLNLDRSSGDDSMDEDLESKQIDSKYNPDDMGDKTEKHDKHAVNSDDLGYSIANHISTDENEMHVENQTRPSVPSEKRKLNDQEAVGSTELVKRQRKWASESLKVTEQQSSPTPKNILTPTVSRGSFSRSDSTVGNEDSPKERVVPPSEKPPTNSLRIDRFLRPFTLKAVQELLGKTGTVTSFWMDHIKTHCYVSYSSVEEAIETRNAVYNLQWPANGGRLLVAEFVDPQEIKNKLEAPQSPAAPITPAPAVPHQPSPRQQVPRQQLPPPPALPPPPPLSNPPPARERLTNLPPPPPPPERQDPPIVTLDDLFRKTRATPRIYYLPLTEEQVAAKLERAKNTK